MSVMSVVHHVTLNDQYWNLLVTDVMCLMTLMTVDNSYQMADHVNIINSNTCQISPAFEIVVITIHHKAKDALTIYGSLPMTNEVNTSNNTVIVYVLDHVKSNACKEDSDI